MLYETKFHKHFKCNEPSVCDVRLLCDEGELYRVVE